jgi:hypothetical protein
MLRPIDVLVALLVAAVIVALLMLIGNAMDEQLQRINVQLTECQREYPNMICIVERVR